MSEFEDAIAKLDISLFSSIDSQSTDSDKRSLLACQLAVRQLCDPFNYLEIGSYLGGSIQPYLADNKCKRIFSIDKRPEKVPDERGTKYTYLNNSTARMLENLAEIAPVEKVTAFDGETKSLPPAVVDERVEFCFIDGEHTDESVISDFHFCLDVLAGNGAIAFHDLSITYNGIAECITQLKQLGKKFRAYALPSDLLVVEIGNFPMHRNDVIFELLSNNYESLLFSLKANDYYRTFANRAPFRVYRNLLARWRGANRFE